MNTEASNPWRCFHCNATFTEVQAAEHHFGRHPLQSPLCTVDAAKYREMEECYFLYLFEDSELHHEVDRLSSGLKVLRTENTGMRDALQRLADWGGLPGSKGYNGMITAEVIQWFRGGMAGPLPSLPEWAQGEQQLL